MTTTALRPVALSRFRRGAGRHSVEMMLEQIEQLTTQRQDLRERSATPAELERNRMQLVRAQWELSHALIERHQAA